MFSAYVKDAKGKFKRDAEGAKVPTTASCRECGRKFHQLREHHKFCSTRCRSDFFLTKAESADNPPL